MAEISPEDAAVIAQQIANDTRATVIDRTLQGIDPEGFAAEQAAEEGWSELVGNQNQPIEETQSC